MLQVSYKRQDELLEDPRFFPTPYAARLGWVSLRIDSKIDWNELRELILVGASGLELRRKAVEEGMITLRGSGLRKVQAGLTTIEEVVRETVK